jgi:hypothetical protein
MATKIQMRRDTAANWTSTNPTLSAGERGFETDTKKWKVGDGTTAWTSLAYEFFNPMTTAGDIVVAGSSGIPTRVAKGANNTVFGVDGSGAVGYKADPTGGGSGVLVPYVTGKYYAALNHITLQTTAGEGMVQGRLYAVPMIITDTQTFDRIAFWVVAQAATSKIRLGIYDDTGDAYPGALIAGGAQVDADVAGERTLTISANLTPGLYWLSYVEQVTDAVTVTSYNPAATGTGAARPIGNATAQDTAMQIAYQATSVSGALPDPFTAAQGTTSAAPRLLLRAA